MDFAIERKLLVFNDYCTVTLVSTYFRLTSGLTLVKAMIDSKGSHTDLLTGGNVQTRILVVLSDNTH